MAVTKVDWRWATTCTLALALCAGCTDGLTVGAVRRPTETVDAAVDVTLGDATDDPAKREAAADGSNDATVGAVLAFIPDCVVLGPDSALMQPLAARLVVMNLGDRVSAPLSALISPSLTVVDRGDCFVEGVKPQGNCWFEVAAVGPNAGQPLPGAVLVTDGRAVACTTVATTCSDGGTMSGNDGSVNICP